MTYPTLGDDHGEWWPENQLSGAYTYYESVADNALDANQLRSLYDDYSPYDNAFRPGHAACFVEAYSSEPE